VKTTRELTQYNLNIQIHRMGKKHHKVIHRIEGGLLQRFEQQDEDRM